MLRQPAAPHEDHKELHALRETVRCRPPERSPTVMLPQLEVPAGIHLSAFDVRVVW